MSTDKKLSILYLSVFKEAFDVMSTGEKQVEYRKDTQWIRSRIFNPDGSKKKYDLIQITNGYGSHRPSILCKHYGTVEVSKPNGNFTIKYSNGLNVFIEPGDFMILLGPIVERRNIA